jgi:hypothetical protein
MTSKNCMWALLAFCGSLLTVAAPTVTQAADQPAAQAAKPSTKQDEVTCRYLESQGARMRQRVCAMPYRPPALAHIDGQVPFFGSTPSTSFQR